MNRTKCPFNSSPGPHGGYNGPQNSPRIHGRPPLERLKRVPSMTDAQATAPHPWDSNTKLTPSPSLWRPLRPHSKNVGGLSGYPSLSHATSIRDSDACENDYTTSIC